MDVTFKYKDSIITTPNLEKKLKRMKLTLDDIEIITEEKPAKKIDQEEDSQVTYYIFQNSKGYYLWNINQPDISWYNKQFGIDISDYKLVDTCKGRMPKEYYKWNPETKTGIK